MGYAERHVVMVTTDSSGDGTGYTPVVSGKVESIRYVKTDFANGVDVSITAEASGETIWAEDNMNASATRHPRAAVHGTNGVAAVYASAGEAVMDKIAIAADRVKIVVAQGGSVTTGTFHVLIS